jgi:hypothetical protein
MSTTINGAEILRTIGSNASAFSNAAVEIQKAALSIVAAQLKAKSLDCAGLSGLGQILGLSTFELVLDNLPDKTVAVLAKKLDPHHPDGKTASPSWNRKHLCALAAGETRPSPKPSRTAAPKKPSGARKAAGTAKPGSARISAENFWPSSMSAVGSRKRR